MDLLIKIKSTIRSRIYNYLKRKIFLKLIIYSNKHKNELKITVDDYKDFHYSFSDIKLEFILNNDDKYIYNNKNFRKISQYKNKYIYAYEGSSKDLSNLFANFYELVEIKFITFYRTNITHLSKMFKECTHLKKIDFYRIISSNVICMGYMFSNCHSLTKIENIDNLNTGNVINMSGMFHGCYEIKELELNIFNTSKVKFMECMFSKCKSLYQINIDNFSTNNLLYAKKMFNKCNSLKYLNLNHFNTKLVRDMSKMFYKCNSLQKIIIDNFDISKVKLMKKMFSNCNSLTVLNLKSFKNTDILKDISFMFSECYKLKKLIIDNMNFHTIGNMYCAFYNCVNLEAIPINNFRNFHARIIKSMFPYPSVEVKNQLDIYYPYNSYYYKPNTKIIPLFFHIK